MNPDTLLREAALGAVKELREALESYASHQSWRCDYRHRYGECQCGLDELMTRLGLPLVPPNDPEANLFIFPCHVCERSFEKGDALAEHMATEHGG